ncbi:Pimeloyl-ACP methyl ester carboxylesterase [Clostridium cavendishii DSM 21758]|uniref:Pimeloyl-ACP methyl ester carboxylesterase n=1 Tax=Clostridium cavendishii DSM 21758 TaxID=1121302 RepID=A0A1M6PBQ5_9CLOT|nr:alpha/beta hydrolase [Clostridium cavendishii]SHK05391.1 Pimeloyl-ACP methyl ester carboxylesterase [Clostridium cavendishii DSM 21758]
MKRLSRAFFFIMSFLLLFIILGNLIAYLSIFLHYDGVFSKTNTQKVNNIDINYKILGEGSPVLLIHDLNSSSVDFNEISTLLSKTNKIVLLDLPGCGLSSTDENINYSKENLAKTCNDLMNKLGYSKYSLIGHSTGGNLCTEITKLYPNSISKLILLSPNIFSKPNKNIFPPIILKALKLNYFSSLIHYYNSFYNKNFIDFNTFEENFYYTSQKPSKSLSKLYLVDISFKEEDLKNINTSTLILWGMNDKILPFSDSYKLNDTLKNSKLVLLSQTGHNPHLETKEIVLKEINAFLSR